MSVGVLAHLCGSLPYRELAAKIGETGFRYVQLALWKAFSDIDFKQPGKLSPGLAMSIGEEFAKHGVSIAVLGCYVHLHERDEVKRRLNIARYKEQLRYAGSFGCKIVACEVGVPDDWDHVEADWKVLRASIEELAEEAERWGVFVGIEPADRHLIGTARALHQMLQEVPSTSIGVVLDPGNLMTADNFHRQDEVIREAFELLGDRIISFHAKDRIVDDDGSIRTVAPGEGTMNYDLYMELLQQYKPGAFITLEAVKADNMLKSKGFVEAMLNQANSKR